MRDEGKFLGGADIDEPPKIFIGGAANPFAEPYEWRVHRLAKKVAAGVDFIQTQCIFNMDRMRTWVKQAVVSRALFHRINVEIVERKPIATTALSSGRCGLVGEGGVIVSTSCEEMASLPVLVGASFSGSAAGARTLDARVVELLEAFGDAACGLLIRAFDVSDPTSVVLEADEGVRVLLGVIDDAGSRAVELAALCRTIEATNYELIDLRFEGEATLVPR